MIEETRLHWASRLRIEAEERLALDGEEALEKFVAGWRGRLAGAKELPLSERRTLFAEIERLVRRVHPPPEALQGSAALFAVWEEYLRLSSSKEYLLYLLEEAQIGLGSPRLYLWLAKVHLQQRDFVLADEWLRAGLKKFPTHEEFAAADAELLAAVELRLKELLGDLGRLYSRNNWHLDPGIDAQLFNSLLRNPVDTRRAVLFGFQENLDVAEKPAGNRGLKRLSDGCLVEIRKGLSIFIDREKRDQYFGKTTMLARELEYREAQMGLRKAYRHPGLTGELDSYLLRQAVELQASDSVQTPIRKILGPKSSASVKRLPLFHSERPAGRTSEAEAEAGSFFSALKPRARQEQYFRHR